MVTIKYLLTYIFSRRKTHLNDYNKVSPTPHVLGYFKFVIKIPINVWCFCYRIYNNNRFSPLLVSQIIHSSFKVQETLYGYIYATWNRPSFLVSHTTHKMKQGKGWCDFDIYTSWSFNHISNASTVFSSHRPLPLVMDL